MLPRVRRLTLSKAVGSAFEAEATSLFARFTTPPTDARKLVINQLIVDLKSAGVWAKLDALYILAAADAQAARRNWITDALNAVATSSPTFTADRGYAGNGTSSYLNTGFVPSTAGGLFSQNSGHISAWSLTSRAANISCLMGATTGSGGGSAPYVNIFTRFTGDLAYFTVNSQGLETGISNTATAGLFVASRTGSAASQGYRNGSALGAASSVASTGRSNNAIALLGRLSSDGIQLPTSDQIAMASIGSGLDATDAANFHSAVETYLQAVGAV